MSLLPSLHGPCHGDPLHERILAEWHRALADRDELSWWRLREGAVVQARLDDLTATLAFLGQNPWILEYAS